MILKTKKILMGSLVGVVVVGASLAIPLVLSKNDSKETIKPEIKTLQQKFKDILALTTEEDVKAKTQELFGLVAKDDAAVANIPEEEKERYENVNKLAKYIFSKKNKNIEFQTEVKKFKGEDITHFIIVFNEETNNSNSTQATGNDLEDKFLDKAKDEFAIKGVLYKGKIIQDEFVKGKIAKVPTSITPLETIDYSIIDRLMKLDGKTNLKASDFSTLPIGFKLNDGKNNTLIDAVKDYFVAISGNTITKANITDKLAVSVLSEKQTGTGTPAKGEANIKFAFSDIYVTKTATGFDWKPATTTPKTSPKSNHTVNIQSGSNTKIADEVTVTDIDVSKLTGGVTVTGVAPSTSPADGTTVTVTFSDNTTAELGGFISYANKAIEYVKTIKASTIQGEFDLTKLPSDQVNSVKTKIETKLKTLVPDTTKGKTNIENIITSLMVTLTPNNVEGKMSVQFTIGDKPVLENPIIVSGLLTKAQSDAKSITPSDIETSLNITNKAKIKASTYKKDASISINLVKNKSTFKIKLTYGVADDAHGTLKVTEAKITNPNNLRLSEAASSFEISNFVTELSDEVKIKNIQEELNSFVPNNPSEKVDTAADVLDNILKPLFSEINSYNATLSIDRNNWSLASATGSVTFEVNYKIGDKEAEKTFTIDGIFKTDAERAQKSIDDLVVSKTVTTPPVKAENTSIKNGEQTTTKDFVKPSQEGFKFTYKKSSVVKEDGSATVTYSVDVDPSVDGVTSKPIQFTISGFETEQEAKAREEKANVREEADKNIAAIKEAIAAFGSNGALTTGTSIDPVTKATFNATVLETLAGSSISLPQDLQGTTLTYTHAGIDADGELEVIVYIAKVGTDKQEEAKFKIVVSGIDLAQAKKNAIVIINQISNHKKNVLFNDPELFTKINTSITDAKQAIKGALNIESINQLVKSSTEGSEVIKINRAIKDYNDAIYNHKYKVVATNDDNKNDNQEIYFEDGKGIIVVKKFDKKEQINLLQNLKFNNEEERMINIKIDAVKAPDNKKNVAFTLEDLQSRIQEQNFKFYSSTYAMWTENTENNDVAKEFKLKSSSGRKISAQLKWVKNANETWNLQLVYNDQEHGDGEDDSIYRYKVKSINKTLNYNEKSKVVATNDDNTAEKDFQDIYDKSDFKNVIVSKKSEKGQQVDLLQDLSFDQDEPSYFKVNIKKVINSESTSGDPFTLEDIENRIFPDENIEQVKTTYIKWDPSYKDQRSVAIYNDTITNAAEHNIKLELKWEKNTNNKWALKLNYVSFHDSSGEDDAIYIYDVKPIETASESQKQQANIQEIKTIIQQITAHKNSTQTIDAVSTATTLNENAWKNLVDDQAFFDTKGTTLTYTHNGITQDGDLEVTVNITKGSGNPATAQFTVKVTGINAAKANSDQTDNVTAINGLTTAAVGKSAVLPTNAGSITNAATFETATGITFPTLKGNATVAITATPDDTNGKISLSIVITTPNATTPAATAIAKVITGFQTVDRAAALAAIHALKSEYFNQIYPENNNETKRALNNENISEDKKTAIVNAIKQKIKVDSAKALITNNLIRFTDDDANGKLIINVNIVPLGGTNEKTIEINGFLTTNQRELNMQQKEINKLISTGTVTAQANPNISAGTLFDETVARSLGLNITLKNKKFTYTYEKTASGVKITVKLKADTSLTAKTTPREINITFAE